MWKIYKILFIIGSLASFASWMSYYISPLLLVVIMTLLSFILVLCCPKAINHKFNNGGYWMLLLFIAIILGAKDSNLFGYIRSILSIVPIYVILQLKPWYQKDLLQTMVKWFAFIYGISWLFWLLHLYGLDLPYNILDVGADIEDVESFKDSQYHLYNYFLFIENKSRLVDAIVPRFSSIFIEPGYAGCLLSILLCLGKYDFHDRKNIIFLIALISTFSLAGYLITIVGYVLHIAQSKKRKILWLIMVFGVFALLFNFFKWYDDGNNFVNMALIERVEIDESTGQMSGYNRSEEQFSDWFWKEFVVSPNIFFGESQAVLQKMGLNNVDWKMYVTRYGLFALCAYIIFLMYPYLTSRSKHKNDILLLTLVYVLIFAQTIFFIFSQMYLSLFVLGVCVMKNSSHTTMSKMSSTC